MSFFDKKTDVIKIELTQYGKHLLSKGKFKPVYYEFFDNDVLYDGKYGNILETRNDIQERIKNQTAYSRPQYNFSGVETKLKKQNEIRKKLRSIVEHSKLRIPDMFGVQNTEEKINLTSYPLGTSIQNDKYPIFNLFAGDVLISSSLDYSDLNGYNIHVPQVIMEDCYYEYRPKNIEDEMSTERNIITSNLFPDEQTYLEIKEETVLLRIEETNVKDIVNNYDIEIFEITSSNGKQIYLPLYFTEDLNNIDINSVEYYLDVSVDNEISESDLNKIANRINAPQLFVKIK